MIRSTKVLLVFAALAACMTAAMLSYADQITRETVIQTPDGTTTKRTVTTETPLSTTTTTWQESTERAILPASSTRIINFVDFDVNRDAIMSVNEIGETLFNIYDTDGNEVIDNIEYDRRAAVTIMPVEKNTVVHYDMDNDGIADKVTYTYETFMQNSLLARFDANRDGLSPREFTGLHFMEADVNNDKAVDLAEWKGSYIPAIDKKNKAEARFNK